MARSMSFIRSSSPSGAQVTRLRGLPLAVRLDDATSGGAVVGGGGAVAGESLRAFAIDFNASSNGLNDDGCATFGSGSFFAGGGGAFLKLGSFGFGFGPEKNEESDFASLTSLTTAFASFLTATGFVEVVEVETAAFFEGGTDFTDALSAFRFLPFASGNESH